jgi:hypothetical protein
MDVRFLQSKEKRRYSKKKKRTKKKKTEVEGEI